jgi:ATP-dependent DNA helicase DinG
VQTRVDIRTRSVELLDTAVSSKDGGAVREPQRDMCAAVGDAFESGDHLLVEAPTGTGKSLAYLAAAVAAVEGWDGDDARVVISTATKALQEQLIDIDLPFVADTLADAGASFSYAMLKGRSNYACRQRLSTFAGGAGPVLFDDDGDAVDAVVEWAEDSPTGDRSDGPQVSDAVWSKVSISSQECPGATECPFGDTCFTELARQRARAADVVVVNTHLYAAHLASDGNLLPPHRAVVFDEAHELEDVVVSALAVSITQARVTSAAALASAAGASTAPVKKLRDRALEFSSVFASKVGDPVDLAGDQDLAVTLAALDAAASDVVVALEGRNRGDVKRDAAAAQAIKALRSLSDDLAAATAADTEDGSATWVEGTVDRPRLCAARIDVAPFLAQQLFATTTVVATSATLAIGGTFDVPASRLGLTLPVDGATPRFDTLRVDTPFDYAKQGMLYVARGLPDPTKQRAEFEPAARAELAELAVAAGGRTLALFTSTAATRAAAEYLREHTDLHVFAQGDAPRSVLVDEFSSTDRSVLVATSSFWTGLDLHGDRCTLVVIDRIPFPRPNDPVLMARTRLVERRGGNGFTGVSLPAAAVTLAQGVGRLIRSTDDRGVVAILDRRLATARYASLLLDTIPPLWRTDDRDRVAAALRRLDAAARSNT